MMNIASNSQISDRTPCKIEFRLILSAPPPRPAPTLYPLPAASLSDLPDELGPPQVHGALVPVRGFGLDDPRRRWLRQGLRAHCARVSLIPVPTQERSGRNSRHKARSS
jgi:hypothetical protein